MTLLIACLVIYGLDMSPWLYAVALAIWVVQMAITWAVLFALGGTSTASI